MKRPASILLVEDDDDDVFLMRRALKAAAIINPIYVLEDGQEAVDYLHRAYENRGGAASQLPTVIFLDLKLPVMMGLEVLAWIRSQAFLAHVAVVVLTSSNEPSDLKEAYRLGATSYLVKPPTAEQLLDLAKAFKWDWLEIQEN
jgi:CheY-like chemotaxis protein